MSFQQIKYIYIKNFVLLLLYLRIEALENIVHDEKPSVFVWHIALDIQVHAVIDTWLSAWYIIKNKKPLSISSLTVFSICRTKTAKCFSFLTIHTNLARICIRCLNIFVPLYILVDDVVWTLSDLFLTLRYICTKLHEALKHILKHMLILCSKHKCLTF